MPIESNHPLFWFKDELYHIPEKRRDKHVKNPKTGARFRVLRQVRKLAPWRITENSRSLEHARCKKILLCDYAFDSSFAMQQSRLDLLHDLVREGFEISVFTKNNTIVPLDPTKIQDLDYLHDFFEQTQFFHPKPTSPEMHQAIAQLKSQGEANPQDKWCFLDSYTVEKILYAYQQTTPGRDPSTKFTYSLSLDPSQGFTTQNPQFSSFLEAIPTEKIEHLNFAGAPKYSDISAYSQLKSIKIIINDKKNLNFLEEVPCRENIENLTFQCCTRLPDLKKFSALKTLSLRISNDTELPPLPDSLESLKINMYDELKDLSALRKLTQLKCLDIYPPDHIKQLDFLPDSLEELTVYTTSLVNLSDLKNCPKLKKLHLVLENFDSLQLEHLTDTLEKIIIEDNQSLTQLPDLKQFSKLKTLKLLSLPQLETLPPLPPSLTALHLHGLRKLKKLPPLPDTLEELHINMCPLEELPDFNQFPKLRKLSLDTKNLKLPLSNTVEELTLNNNPIATLDLSTLPNLRKLTIQCDHFLPLLKKGYLPPNLEELTITGEILQQELDLSRLSCLKKLALRVHVHSNRLKITQWPPKLTTLDLFQDRDNHKIIMDNLSPGVKITYSPFNLKSTNTKSKSRSTTNTPSPPPIT